MPSNRCEYCGHEEWTHEEETGCTDCKTEHPEEICYEFKPDVFNMWGEEE